MSDPVPPLRRWLGHPWVWVGGALLVFGLGGAIVLRQVKPARLGALRQTLDGRPLVSRTWTNIDARYWQLASSVREDRAVTDAAEGTRGPCGAGMVHVAGNFLLEDDGGDVLFKLQHPPQKHFHVAGRAWSRHKLGLRELSPDDQAIYGS